MGALVIGAILLGSASSWVVGFIPFFLAVLASVALGAGLASVRGVSLGDLPLPGLALLVTAQLAYGSGLMVQLALSRSSLAWKRRAGRATAPLAREERRPLDGKAVDPAHHHGG